MAADETTIELTSLGCLCGQLQQTPYAINSAAAQLGIAPTLRLNGVPHFSREHIERIAELLRAIRATRDTGAV